MDVFFKLLSFSKLINLNIGMRARVPKKQKKTVAAMRLARLFSILPFWQEIEVNAIGPASGKYVHAHTNSRSSS